MTGDTDHAAGDAMTSELDAGPPPAGLVDEVEGSTADRADHDGGIEQATSDDGVVDAGPPPAGLVDELEGFAADRADHDEGAGQATSDGDVVDAGPPPAALGEEVESLEDD